MATALNDSAVEAAKKLIRTGKVEKGNGDWSEHQPSTEDENEYIASHGLDKYGEWFLAVDTTEDEDNKTRYKFPYGDFKKVHEGGLIAAKQRAGQYKYHDIEDAAEELIEEIGA
jgi:hypothetical protein